MTTDKYIILWNSGEWTVSESPSRKDDTAIYLWQVELKLKEDRARIKAEQEKLLKDIEVILASPDNYTKQHYIIFLERMKKVLNDDK
jgi:hypothetical protein